MGLSTMEREDVIAALKKRFRFVSRFERAYGLPEKSVGDLLRGRTSARVADAIEDALSKSVDSYKSESSDRASNKSDSTHRLNTGAR